jgi:hypothetical protein
VPKLDTDYGSFKDLIAVARVYTVPLYQRRYSWKPNAQVAELWSDVCALYRNDPLAGSGVDSFHRLRSCWERQRIVLLVQERATSSTDNSASRLKPHSRCIRDTIVDDDSAKSEITTEYLTFPKTDEARLVMSQADAPIYRPSLRQILCRTASRRCTEPMHTSSESSSQHVEDTIPTRERTKRGMNEAPWTTAPRATKTRFSRTTGSHGNSVGVEDSVNVLSQDLELVSISGVPAERAYQIFATLNHAGLKLTQVDLIRNAVFMKLPERNQEAYKKIWQP